MVAVRCAHVAGRKDHEAAVGASECTVGRLPSIVGVRVFLAVSAFVGAESVPAETRLVVEHEFLPFIQNQMSWQNKISGDEMEISLPARSTGADSGVVYERLISAQGDRSARACFKADAALDADCELFALNKNHLTFA